MIKRHLRVPSPALVISLIALFVALGGTSYAAIKLPANSVGSKQLKANAVTGAKIKNGAVTANKINSSGLTVPNAAHSTTADSATSATHAASADSATSATSAASAANATDLGGEPASFYSSAILQSGQSESGIFAVAAGDSASGSLAEGIMFPRPLAAPLDPSHVDWRDESGPDATCPAEGEAAPGYLCVYPHSSSNVGLSGGRAINTHAGGGGADPYGFMLFLSVTGADAYTYGTWTVTAP